MPATERSVILLVAVVNRKGPLLCVASGPEQLRPSRALSPTPERSPSGQISMWATSPRLLCEGEKKGTKLFTRVKSVPNHKKPEAKNLLYTFLLSEIILSLGIYNYMETTRLRKMRKYNTIISSQTFTEIWQKSTGAENAPSPFPSAT